MSKLLENAPLDVKLGVCINALTYVTQQAVINQRREAELLDRLEAVVKMLEVEGWAGAIRAEIHRRDRMNFTKGKHIWKQRRPRPQQKR